MNDLASIEQYGFQSISWNTQTKGHETQLPMI